MTFQKTTIGALIAVATLSAAPAHASKPDVPGEYARGRVLVELKAGVSDDDLEKSLKPHGGKGRRLGQSQLHIVHLPPNASETDMVEKLSARPEFKFVELDYKVESTLAINDPYAGSAWHLNKVGTPAAWDIARGVGVTIAVLDSGIDATHPDLRSNIVPGFNTLSNTADVSDACGHGTAVAGVAAATLNNGLGVAGIAGNARIMPVRIASINASTGACEGYASAVARGLTYAADHGARIANVSYSTLASSATVISAANYMKSKNGLVFASAGNLNQNIATLPTTSLIVVSATDSADNKSTFSNYGSFVSIAAPGTGIWTTSRGGIYQPWNGTSFASPLAAGVAALMMSARPDLSALQIEKILFSSATDLGAAGKDPIFGHGRVNAAAAVAAVRAYANVADTIAPTAAIASPTASSSVTGSVTVAVNAADNVGVSRVALKVNGTVVATDSGAPFSLVWNSAGAVNGINNLVAVAYDAAGNAGASANVAVNVANAAPPPVTADTIAPTMAINNPVAGSVAGNVTVSVSASDNRSAASIAHTLKIDGVTVATGYGSALSYNWNTRKYSKALHTVTASARDAAGNTTTKSVTVTVR